MVIGKTCRKSPAVPGIILPKGIYTIQMASVAVIIGVTSSRALLMAACQEDIP